VRAIQAAVEDVTQNYLETLDALGTVYDAAAGFAQLFESSSIAHFTLQRILEALELGCGAIFLEDGGSLRFQFDAESALTLLKEQAIEDASLEGRSLFLNGAEAAPHLRPQADGRNVLLAPVVAAQRRLGIIVVLSRPERPFTTKDLKLVGAVTSQAAIALSGAQHLEQVLVERQKLRSIIENSAGGIVVLTPDGRTTLTNAVARKLLGLEEGRAEGYSLIDALPHWKFSRQPESLHGEGPPEISLEMTTDRDAQARSIWVVGRRVRASDGELVNIVLNLHDPAWTQAKG
jgi:PAS domain S-box-containing protein